MQDLSFAQAQSALSPNFYLKNSFYYVQKTKLLSQRDIWIYSLQRTSYTFLHEKEQPHTESEINHQER